MENSISGIIRSKANGISYGVQGRSVTSVMSTSILAGRTSSISQGFNYQMNQKIQYLTGYKEAYREAVQKKLEMWPDYRGDRGKGVGLAWEYERTDIEWGGRGSENWNRSERKEILRRGTLSGAEGHHQQNVADHPLEQANPDNIKFYRTKEEHLQKGHGGSFQNESDAPMIDRAKMLEKTNRKRVVKNEIKGASLTAIIAFATTASLTFVLELAKNGNNPQEVKRALKNAGRSGLEGMAMAVVCYGITRLIMEPAKKRIAQVLEKIGLKASGEIIGTGIAAVVVVVVTGVWTYIKLRQAGISIKNSLRQVGKQALSQIVVSATLIVIQALLGTVVAIAASVAYAIFLLGYSIYQISKEKKLIERIRIYTVEHSYPHNYTLA